MAYWKYISTNWIIKKDKNEKYSWLYFDEVWLIKLEKDIWTWNFKYNLVKVSEPEKFLLDK